MPVVCVGSVPIKAATKRERGRLLEQVAEEARAVRFRGGLEQGAQEAPAFGLPLGSGLGWSTLRNPPPFWLPLPGTGWSTLPGSAVLLGAEAGASTPLSTPPFTAAAVWALNPLWGRPRYGNTGR